MQTSHLRTLYLAWRNVVRQQRRTFFVVCAVAASAVAIILSSGFINWIFWQLREATIYGQLGHLQVTARGYTQSGESDPFGYVLPTRSEALSSLSGLPEVKTVAPRLGFSGLVSAGDASVSFLGEGVDPAHEGELSKMVSIEAGENLSESEPAGAIVGEGLAHTLGVQPGDKIVLMASTENGGTNAVEVTVRGLFSTAYKSYDDRALRTNLVTAQNLLRVQGAHRWVVLLHRTEDTDRVYDSLKGSGFTARFDVTPWHVLSDFYNKTRDLFERQFFVLKLIIVCAVLLGISNSFMMNIVERTSEIGTISALGTPRRQVLLQFLAEALIVGLLGGLIGILLGLGAAKVISAVGIPMPPPPGMAHGYLGRILVTPGQLVESFVLSTLACLLAAAHPAWRAASMNIVEALRHAR